MEFHAPWEAVAPDEAVRWHGALAARLTPEHSLAQAPFVVIARRTDADQILCEVTGYQWRFAAVDLSPTQASGMWSPSIHRFHTSEDLTRHMQAVHEACVRNDPGNDVDLDMDEDVARLFSAMPASCELPCCGFDCIRWDADVYERMRSEALQERLGRWLHEAIDRIEHRPIVRWVHASRHDIRNGDPVSTVGLFQDILGKIAR